MEGGGAVSCRFGNGWFSCRGEEGDIGEGRVDGQFNINYFR